MDKTQLESLGRFAHQWKRNLKLLLLKFLVEHSLTKSKIVPKGGAEAEWSKAQLERERERK